MFVVIGFLLILVGRFTDWSWIYHRVFRFVHLLAIAFVVAQSYLGQICPLTIWENYLRIDSGQAGYEGSFIRYWLQRILYYDVDPWIFGIIYTILGSAVLVVTVVDRKKIDFFR